MSVTRICCEKCGYPQCYCKCRRKVGFLQRMVRSVLGRPFLRVTQTPCDIMWEKGWIYPCGKPKIEELGMFEFGMVIKVRKGTRYEHVHSLFPLNVQIKDNAESCVPQPK
jgi:hypothetical protein